MVSEPVTRVAVLHAQVLVRETLAGALEGAGFKVAGLHADGEGFLAALEQDRELSAALIDLPSIGNTPELLLTTGQSHPNLRILLLSQEQDRAAAERCFELGAAGLLDRSTVETPVVVQAIHAVLNGLRVFPASLLGSLFNQSSGEGAAPLRTLSAREREVLTYIAGGADNLKIASCLEIAERTVKAHVSALYRKLGQENRTQLALLARQMGVRPPAGV